MDNRPNVAAIPRQDNFSTSPEWAHKETTMTPKQTVLAFAAGLALITLAASPALAGGPVIIEDTESAPIIRSKRDHTALLIFGAIVVGALLLGGGGGSDSCNGDEQPTPEPGPCQ